MKLTDSQIVDDMIGSMSRAGYNTDRSMITTIMTVILEDLKDSNYRLKAIYDTADLTNEIKFSKVIDE